MRRLLPQFGPMLACGSSERCVKADNRIAGAMIFREFEL
jgi:hypothetical protein